MRKHPNYYTPETIKKIEQMADKGITDKEIAETLNLTVSGVSGRTRDFWKKKFLMKITFNKH